MRTSTQPTSQASDSDPRGGGFQPPVTCYNQADLDQPAQTTLYEIMRDCDHMLSDLQMRLLAIASDLNGVDCVDGVSIMKVHQVSILFDIMYEGLIRAGSKPDWTPPSDLEVAQQFAAIAELGLIAIATVGSPEHFLVFIGTPHHQSAVVKAAAEFINATFSEHAAA